MGGDLHVKEKSDQANHNYFFLQIQFYVIAIKISIC